MIAFMRRHKVLSSLVFVFVFVVVFLAAFLGWRMRGPYRSYRLDFVLPAVGDLVEPGVLEVGVAKRDITPDLLEYDEWTDIDQNERYEPEKGDTYLDINGNGRFDAVWMAGFNEQHPAKDVHDPLWARAIALRNNGVTVAMVTIDSIGMMHEKFLAVREALDPKLDLDHVMFSCTHNHEAPDTMGLWSYKPFNPFNPYFGHDYVALVQAACKEAVEEAVANLAPSDMVCAEVEVDPEHYVRDTRQPICHDRKVCCMQFLKHGTDETVATVVSWGNHAEALGSGNSLITSDFAHYLRQGVESGVSPPNGAEGLGGMCLYFQGMVGGLMTPLHLKVPHRDGEYIVEGDTFQKAEALGENVALRVLEALRGETAWRQEKPKVAVAAKSIFVPLEGLFKWGIMLGLIHPGYFNGKARSEIDVIRIGNVEVLTCPGELYPEIAEGGIETPEGADYPIAPVEEPPLREVMAGKMNLVVGLANDELGYIIPKSQWDKESPYAYGRTDRPQYGEENSGGPEVAPTYHREAMALLARMHEAF